MAKMLDQGKVNNSRQVALQEALHSSLLKKCKKKRPHPRFERGASSTRNAKTLPRRENPKEAVPNAVSRLQ